MPKNASGPVSNCSASFALTDSVRRIRADSQSTKKAEMPRDLWSIGALDSERRSASGIEIRTNLIH